MSTRPFFNYRVHVDGGTRLGRPALGDQYGTQAGWDK
jgi:hypothetical protein